MIDQAGANVRRITPLFADGVQAASERAGRLLPAGPCGSDHTVFNPINVLTSI